MYRHTNKFSWMLVWHYWQTSLSCFFFLIFSFSYYLCIFFNCSDYKFLQCFKNNSLSMHAAAVTVARKEKWRRIAVWSRVHDFYSLTQLNITSPIISLIIGSEEAALSASRFSPFLILHSTISSIMLFLKRSVILLILWTGICLNLDSMWQQSDHLQCLQTRAGNLIILS